MNNPGAAGFQDIASALTAIASNPGKTLHDYASSKLFR